MRRPRGDGRRPPPTPPKTERASPTLEARRTLWVFCEGKKTEPGWLEHLHRRFYGLNLRIEVESAVGVPQTIFQRAKAKVTDIRRSPRRVEHMDEVWAVFDRDGFLRIPDVWQGLRDNGIGLVFSNPCFEIWPVLHLQPQTSEIHRGNLQALLHQAHPSYHHERSPQLDWAALQPKTRAAVADSIALHLRHEGAGHGLNHNPSNTAWLLHERCANAEDQTGRWFITLARQHPSLSPLAWMLAEPLRAQVQQDLGSVPYPAPPREGVIGDARRIRS